MIYVCPVCNTETADIPPPPPARCPNPACGQDERPMLEKTTDSPAHIDPPPKGESD